MNWMKLEKLHYRLLQTARRRRRRCRHHARIRWPWNRYGAWRRIGALQAVRIATPHQCWGFMPPHGPNPNITLEHSLLTIDTLLHSKNQAPLTRVGSPCRETTPRGHNTPLIFETRLYWLGRPVNRNQQGPVVVVFVVVVSLSVVIGALVVDLIVIEVAGQTS